MITLRALPIILGAYLALASPLQNALAAAPPEKQLTVQTTSLVTGPGKDKFAGLPQHVKANYHAILTYVQERNTDYVRQARRTSACLEDSIKCFGIKRIVGIGNTAHGLCLDLALQRINRKMSGEEFNTRTREISRQYYGDMQEVNVSAPIDFTKDIVIQACQQKVILDISFYERLLNSNLGANSTPEYKALVESSLTEEEYSEQVSKQLSAIDSIYDALLKSRVGFRGLFAVSGINTGRNIRKEYCRAQAEKIHATKGIPNMLKPKARELSTQRRVSVLAVKPKNSQNH